MFHLRKLALPLLVIGALTNSVFAEDKPIVGLIPKAQKPIKMDGKLTDWDGAFVAPVHVGHPDFANRGGEFLYLWDEQNLYIGLRCLDRHPAHVGGDNQVWNGDAVEFYLDTRRGDQLGAVPFGPGTLHMFWTAFTKTEVKPRFGIRDLPAFKGFHLQGVEIAGAKTAWGYTAEFKLPWANFPNFAAKAGEIIGIECELCSSDGGPRVDRTFVYASPAAVGSPSAFGRVQLVDKIDVHAAEAVRASSVAAKPDAICELRLALRDGVRVADDRTIGREIGREARGRRRQSAQEFRAEQESSRWRILALDWKLGIVRSAGWNLHAEPYGFRQGWRSDHFEDRESAPWQSGFEVIEPRVQKR